MAWSQLLLAAAAAVLLWGMSIKQSDAKIVRTMLEHSLVELDAEKVRV